MQTVSKVKKFINPSLQVDGILLTLVDGRTNLAKSTVDALRESFGGVMRIYRSPIPSAVRVEPAYSPDIPPLHMLTAGCCRIICRLNSWIVLVMREMKLLRMKMKGLKVSVKSVSI